MTSRAAAPTPTGIHRTALLEPLTHSELLVEKLQAEGVETETVFFPADHEPPLGHEYQFDLDTDAAQRFLERLLAFLQQRLATPAGGAR